MLLLPVAQFDILTIVVMRFLMRTLYFPSFPPLLRMSYALAAIGSANELLPPALPMFALLIRGSGCPTGDVE
jgi:hypothetical protein